MQPTMIPAFTDPDSPSSEGTHTKLSGATHRFGYFARKFKMACGTGASTPVTPESPRVARSGNATSTKMVPELALILGVPGALERSDSDTTAPRLSDPLSDLSEPPSSPSPRYYSEPPPAVLPVLLGSTIPKFASEQPPGSSASDGDDEDDDIEVCKAVSTRKAKFWTFARVLSGGRGQCQPIKRPSSAPQPEKSARSAETDGVFTPTENAARIKFRQTLDALIGNDDLDNYFHGVANHKVKNSESHHRLREYRSVARKIPTVQDICRMQEDRIVRANLAFTDRAQEQQQIPAGRRCDKACQQQPKQSKQFKTAKYPVSVVPVY